MNLARARWRFLRNASGVTCVRIISPSLAAISSMDALGKSRLQLKNGGVAVLGCGRLIGFQPGPDAIDHGFAPDPVEIFVGPSGIEQVAGGKRLKLPRPEVVDDQAVEDGSQVISKSPFALVGSGQLAGQQLGPELLQDLVGQVLVANLQVDVSCHGVVIPADELLHGRLAFGGRCARRARRMGAADGRPDRRNLGQTALLPSLPSELDRVMSQTLSADQNGNDRSSRAAMHRFTWNSSIPTRRRCIAYRFLSDLAQLVTAAGGCSRRLDRAWHRRD